MDREAEKLLDEQVMADVMGASTPEAAPETAEQSETVEPLPETGVEAAPATPEAQPETPAVTAPETPAQQAEKEYKVKHRGQETVVKLTPEQELEYIQKGYDYTAKTMELADFRRNAEEVIKQVQQGAKDQAEAVIRLLNDPEKLEAIAAAKRAALGQSATAPTTPATPQGDELETEFISKSQLQAYLKEMEQKIETKVRGELEKGKVAVKDDIEMARARETYRGDFDAHLNSLLKEKFPLLSEFGDDDVADKIRADAYKFTQAFLALNPGAVLDPSQVKSAMVDSAKKRSEAIEGKLRDREKKLALSQAKLVSNGPEPKGGGAAPAPPAGKKLSLKDPALDAQVLREIESIMGKNP